MKNGLNIRIALVCTKGGHFEQMNNLSDFYNCYDHFWITNRSRQTESQLLHERVYYVDLAHFRRPWTYVSQMLPIFRIFVNEKPTHVLSTGSGRTALIPYVLSRIFRVKFIFIDTFSRVRGHSKFGTFLLKMNNRIFTQWEDPLNKQAIYLGPIFKQQKCIEKCGDTNYVFVTVGTREEPFTRLVKGVDDLVKKGIIKDKVIIQAGHTKYHSNSVELFDFCQPEKIDELILNAKYVITQESAGIGTQCLKNKTKFIVVPRDYQWGELPARSDMKEDLQDRLEEMGYTTVVRNMNELENAIVNIDRLKTGFAFNNSLAIATLHKNVEEL